MSSIDATPPAQQEKKASAPVKHPRWCDRSVCTAPEFVPTDYDPTTGYAHRSAQLATLDDWALRDPEGVFVRLRQGVAPWNTDTYLDINDVHVRISWDSPLLWAILDEHAELEEKLPGLLKTGRKEARRRQQETWEREAAS